MFKRLQLRNKILVPTILLVLFGFGALMTYTMLNVRNVTYTQAVSLAEEMAAKNSYAVRIQLEEALVAARTVGKMFEGAMMHPDSVDRDMLDWQAQQIMLSSDTFFCVCTVIEPNELDGRDAEQQGRANQFAPNGQYRVTWYEDNGQVKGKMAGAAALGDWYTVPMRTGREYVTNAYFEKSFDMWVTTVCVPIKKKGRTVGVTTIDVGLGSLKKITDGIRLFDTGYGFVAGNDGVLLSHPEASLVGKSIEDASLSAQSSEIRKAISAGRSLVVESEDEDGRHLKVFSPLQIGRSSNPWSMGVSVPLAEINAEAQSLLMNSSLVSVGVLVLMAAVIFLVARSIAAPLGKLTSFAEQVAEGDLDAHVSIDQPDEIGRLHGSLTRMVSSLRDVIGQAEEKAAEAEQNSQAATEAMQQAEAARNEAVQARREGMLEAAGHLEEIVTRISAASEELGAQIDESSRGAEIQRERASESATAMEQMNASVLEVARNASEAAESAEHAKSRAVDGGQIVEHVVAGINRVQEESSLMNEGLNDLGRQAEGIGNIMNVISDIADQTNLLALNAAIEAARAGDAGRGFAVVADEVRKLAEKTMTATKEVGQAVAGIQEGTQRSIEGMHSAVSAVQETTELAGQAGEALGSIVSLVEGTADQVRAIATASEEQSAASEQINRGTEEVNSIAAETAEAMQQSSSAVQDVASQIGELQVLIENFKRS